jgi:hypothetical protein
LISTSCSLSLPFEGKIKEDEEMGKCERIRKEEKIEKQFDVKRVKLIQKV